MQKKYCARQKDLKKDSDRECLDKLVKKDSDRECLDKLVFKNNRNKRRTERKVVFSSTALPHVTDPVITQMIAQTIVITNKSILTGFQNQS